MRSAWNDGFGTPQVVGSAHRSLWCGSTLSVRTHRSNNDGHPGTDGGAVGELNLHTERSGLIRQQSAFRGAGLNWCLLARARTNIKCIRRQQPLRNFD